MMQYRNMYRLIFIILILLVHNAPVSGQKPVIINFSDFDNDSFDLSMNPNWFFKTSDGNSWSEINKNSNGWEKLAPGKLSRDHQNPSGNIEGWFKINLQLDETAQDTTIFLNVKSIKQIKNIIINGKPYFSSIQSAIQHGNQKSYGINTADIFIPLNLKPGIDYEMALHYLQELKRNPIDALASQENIRFNVQLLLGEQKVIQLEKQQDLNSMGFSAIAVINILLLLLFIFIWFTNKHESILKVIIYTTICTTLITNLMLISGEHFNPDFHLVVLYQRLFGIFLPLMLFFMVWLFVRVFNAGSRFQFWLISIPALVLSVNIHFFGSTIVSALIVLFYFGISGYYIFRSWKNVNGSQWALVTGFLSVFAVFVILLILNALNRDTGGFLTYYLIFTLYPLSLLTFISLRFKEINLERVDKAKKLLKLTEEKRLQAEQQKDILEEQVKERTAALQQSMENLKATQSQLIHAEKMASLGELTAGIAHEIQNPLNFINNFSEVNSELIEELIEELGKGDLEEVNAIATDLATNEEKIHHHGKRADSIVKGMLQHSRISSNEKELTDINALADEYLRLSYHGMRARDKSFNADFKTKFDESLEKINVLPRDIGRVLLNLINNAFYAVYERSKKETDTYKPEVIVTTKKQQNAVEISVKDNGNGIPEDIKKKIFQPFFTTKPTGEGTGLGLSLSYDIITKGHGGEMIVKTTVGEGSEFIIQLPA